MIEPICEMKDCGKPLVAFGALIASVPNGELVVKKHICSDCYFEKIAPLLSGLTYPPSPGVDYPQLPIKGK